MLLYILHILMLACLSHLLMNDVQDGEAESYRNVIVKFVPGRQAKMTIYEDGVQIAGSEPIDMTLLITKEDMHKLMVDQGFEKLTESELEARNLEQSKLFPTSTSTSTSTDKQVPSRTTRSDRAAERDATRRAAKEVKQRQREDREILGLSAVPSYTNVIQMYAGVAIVFVLAAVYAGVRRQRRRRPATAMRVGLLS
jgi:hypothetical protein